MIERYINTDKYKDYISRWKITGNPNGHRFVIKDSLNVVVAEVNVLEDAILMKDSPKLLAEVRRLRNIILKFNDAIYHGNFDTSQLLGIWYNLLTKEEEE